MIINRGWHGCGFFVFPSALDMSIRINFEVRRVSVDVLVQIREAYAAGKSIDDVEDVLAATGAPTIITVNEQNEMIRALGHIAQQQNQAAACDRFVRDYVDEQYEKRLRQEFELD